MGLTGYYRRFVKGSLTNLLRKDTFSWDSKAKTAFVELKSAITTTLVLTLPNFSDSSTLETNASGTGIRAILSQGGHPIALFSKKLSLNMQHKSTYVREMFAITEAIAKFRHYLLNHKFVIRTDQQSLRALMDQNLQTPEQ